MVPIFLEIELLVVKNRWVLALLLKHMSFHWQKEEINDTEWYNLITDV